MMIIIGVAPENILCTINDKITNLCCRASNFCVPLRRLDVAALIPVRIVYVKPADLLKDLTPLCLHHNHHRFGIAIV